MAATYAEDSTFISDDSTTELRNAERIVKGHLVRDVLLDIEEMNRLAAPFEVVNKFVGRVALLENKCVVQQFAIFVDNINVLVVCDAAG